MGEGSEEHRLLFVGRGSDYLNRLGTPRRHQMLALTGGTIARLTVCIGFRCLLSGRLRRRAIG